MFCGNLTLEQTSNHKFLVCNSSHTICAKDVTGILNHVYDKMSNQMTENMSQTPIETGNVRS